MARPKCLPNTRRRISFSTLFFATTLFLLGASACPDTAVGKVRNAAAKAIVPLPADLETPSMISAYQRDNDGRTVIAVVSEGPKKTRQIFVSSSLGNDDNDGESQEHPLRTVTAAREKLRSGYPDQLLLRRGDVFKESLWLNGLQGLGPGQPILISGYGKGPRPLFKTGTGSGFGLHPNHLHKYLAVVGVAFEAHFRNPGDVAYNPNAKSFDDNSGINATTFGEGLLIEDCVFSYFASGIVVQDVQPRLFKNVELRRNIIHHIWSKGAMAQGIYTYNVDGLLIEENVIDQVGFLKAANAKGTIFNHAMYLQNQGPGLSKKPGLHTVVRGNFVARSDGIQMRDGGLAEHNFLWRTWIAFMCGGGNDSTIGGALCVLRDNVILDGGNITSFTQRGWGLWLLNLRKPSRALRNVIANNTHGGDPRPIYLDGARKDDHGRRQKILFLRLQDNVVYHFGKGLLFEGGRGEFRDVELVNNVIELQTKEPVIVHAQTVQLDRLRSAGNRFFSAQDPAKMIDARGKMISVEEWSKRTGTRPSVFAQTPLIDPTRSLERYAREVAGFKDAAALLNAARNGVAGAQNAKLRGGEIADWIGAGFTRSDP